MSKVGQLAASVPRPGGWLVGLAGRRVLLEVEGEKVGGGGQVEHGGRARCISPAAAGTMRRSRPELQQKARAARPVPDPAVAAQLPARRQLPAVNERHLEKQISPPTIRRLRKANHH